jgi:ketosteroid isomerase-like protein
MDHAAAVRQLIEEWAAAVRARDLDRILAHHAPDLVMFDVPPPIVSKDLEAYRKTWDTFFAWSQTPTVFDIVEMDVTAGSDVAFAFALMRCAGAKDGPLDFRLTVGLRRVGEAWVITHEHHSIPAE